MVKLAGKLKSEGGTMKKFWTITLMLDALLIILMPFYFEIWSFSQGMAFIFFCDLAIVAFSLGVNGKLDVGNLVIFWYGNLVVIVTLMLFLYDFWMILAGEVIATKVLIYNGLIVAMWVVNAFLPSTS